MITLKYLKGIPIRTVYSTTSGSNPVPYDLMKNLFDCRVLIVDDAKVEPRSDDVLGWRRFGAA
jgi:hypothetical protein